MEVQDTAAVFREQNTKFVPMMLARLRDLQNEMTAQRLDKRSFGHLTSDSTPVKKKARRNSSLGSSPMRSLVSPPHNPMWVASPDFEFDKVPQKVNGVKHKDHEGKNPIINNIHI